MSSFTTPVSNTAQGFVPMNPAPDPQHQLSFHTKFLKGEPKALGIVQIMIGVVTLMFGIIVTIKEGFPIAVTGITIWGSLFYISTGAVAVAAANNANYCLVNSSLKMNVISAIVAGIVIILLSFEMLYANFHFYDGYYKYRDVLLMHLSQGIRAVLLILSVMQFILSICISAFACKATCDSNSPARVVCVVRNQYTATTVQSIPNTVQSIPNTVCYMPSTVQYMPSTVQYMPSTMQVTPSAPPPYNEVM